MQVSLNYRESNAITESLISFSRFIRDNGIQNGINQDLEAVRAAKLGILQDKNSLRYSLKSILCANKDEFEKFDNLFDQYWSEKGIVKYFSNTIISASPGKSDKPSSLVILGKHEEDQEGTLNNSHTTSGASLQVRLRKTDFSKVSEIDSDHLERLASDLWKQMSMRLSRKHKIRQNVPVPYTTCPIMVLRSNTIKYV